MATQPAAITRSLPSIAQDLHINGVWFSTLRAQCVGRDPTVDEDAAWTRLEGRQEALQSEFCETLHALTGLTWTRACNAMDVA